MMTRPRHRGGARHVDRELGAVFQHDRGSALLRQSEHRLIDIPVIAVVPVIPCAESWDDIALYGRSKLVWLRTFLELPNGIPSHDTFRSALIRDDHAHRETA